MSIDRIYGPFFGSSLTRDECEAFAIARIDNKLLSKEAELYGTKWFDYRPLHPTMATYLMTHHYNRAYGAFMKETLDHKKRFMAAFKGKDVMMHRDAKSFWRLRQRIDQLGIRYDFFCTEAMKWCANNGWRQPPRPAHVSTNDDLIIYVMNRWHEECQAKIQWAINPRYTASQFVGAVDQIDYERHLAEAIMKRPHPKYALHAALYLYDAVRIESAIRSFPTTALEAAIDLCLAEQFSQN
jgi:hypothetical protein